VKQEFQNIVARQCIEGWWSVFLETGLPPGARPRGIGTAMQPEAWKESSMLKHRCTTGWVMASALVFTASVHAHSELRYRLNARALPSDFHDLEAIQPEALNRRGDSLVTAGGTSGTSIGVYVYRNGPAQRLPGSERYSTIQGFGWR
jgi:hypothetical protein